MDNLMSHDFGRVLHRLSELDLRVVPLTQLKESSNSASLRYDIHRRDIEGAYFFVRSHAEYQVPGTFFLQIGYSSLERDAENDFWKLGDFCIANGVDVGLHTSPVDSFFISTKHAGSSKAYAAWLRSPEFISFVEDIQQYPDKLDELNVSIENHFFSLCSEFRVKFGAAQLISSHGGELFQISRVRDDLPISFTQFLQQFRPNKWMNERRIKPTGFIADVEQSRNHELAQITDAGKGIEHILSSLDSNKLPKKVQILIHPYGWTKPLKQRADLSNVDSAAPNYKSSYTINGVEYKCLNFVEPDVHCKPRCNVVFDKWSSWFQAAFRCRNEVVDGVKLAVPRVPLAVIDATQSQEKYLKRIGDKSRNMLRKAERSGYAFRVFQSADYLEDIMAVRQSMPIRSGKPVPASYSQPVKPFDAGNKNFCERHEVTAIGVFSTKDDTLVAYSALHNCGDFAIINSILGHGDHLRYGVMNLLVYGIFQTVSDRYSSVKYINYLTLKSSTAGLDRFKRSTGFDEINFALPLANEPLPFAEKKIESIRDANVTEPTETQEYPKTASLRTGAVSDTLSHRPLSDAGNPIAEMIYYKSFQKILVRGDCCAIRTVARNPEIFGKPEIVQNEKCTMEVCVDSIDGVHYPDEEILSLSDIDKMAPSLRKYYINQNKMSILDQTEADILIIDSYADSFFQCWKNRKTGAKLWVHAKFLKDREKFERTHVKLPYRTFDEVLRDTATYIEAVRTKNPNIPIMYLTHPIHYYRYLNRRREFCYLGQELERFVPNVYWGTHLPKEQCEPVDMDSCGPGETHHYTPATYAKMVYQAASRTPFVTSAKIAW